MMGQIASLIARGLISPDVAQGLVQRVNDVTNRGGGIGNPPLEGSGGRGVVGGASGRPVVAPDYGRNVKKYNDALVYGKITPEEHEGFMDALGIDKSMGSGMRDRALQEREDLFNSVREQLGEMRQRGLINPSIVAPDYSRPIHPDVLRAMRAEQGMDQPVTSGRQIHPDVLKAMREEQGTAPANQNKTPRQQFIDEYDALVRKKAAEENRKDFRSIKGSKE